MNGVASLVEVGVVPSDARSVTDVGMGERRSRRKKVVRVVVMVAVAAADAGWGRAGEGQLEPCPFPACKYRPGFDLFGVDRYQFVLGRSCLVERRTPAPGNGRNLNQDYGVSEVRGWATSP